MARIERQLFRQLLLAAPGILVIAALLALPMLWLFGLSFVNDGEFSFLHYRRLAFDPSYIKSFVLTFQVAGTVTFACALLGYPLCYWMVGQRPALRRAALICVLIPFWTSLLV